MSLYSSLTQVLAPFAAKINGLLTGWDGTRYNTPGEAVRQQISDLHVLIGDVPGTAIDASAIGYNDSNVAAELANVNGRLTQHGTSIEEITDAIGDLSQLQTENKTDLVSAINEAAQTGGSGSGLTAEIKNALLQIASKVAYIDAHGQDYYNALYDSFYPNVISISAVYTQQGRVYSTTDLNSLKTNLVVTANYKDGTNIRLLKTDYTLSGNLTVGTSTITAAYGDKTATFNVTITGVVSIDAVYTQSGIVSDTDDLSVLIPDLVVTATLNDGTSFVVPSTDYTLSGTLSDRTSTITVIYGSLSDTFIVTVTEVNNYTKNPLENVMWMQGYLYNRNTGVIGASANEWSSDKFTAQNCTYILTNADTTNNKYVLLLAWDENGNYIGFTHNGQGLYALKKNYTYAISLTNTTEFDQSTIILMPKDNTTTKANTFSIRLADFIGNISTYSTVYQIDVSSIMNNAGVTSSNWNDKFASCNYLAALCMNPYPDPFLNRDLRFWFATTTIMRFDCDSVGDNNIAGLEAWIIENDPVITFN